MSVTVQSWSTYTESDINALTGVIQVLVTRINNIDSTADGSYSQLFTGTLDQVFTAIGNAFKEEDEVFPVGLKPTEVIALVQEQQAERRDVYIHFAFPFTN